MKHTRQSPPYSIRCVFDGGRSKTINISKHFSQLGVLKPESASIIVRQLKTLSDKHEEVSYDDMFIFADAHNDRRVDLERNDLIRLEALGLLTEYIDETLRTWSENRKQLDYAYLVYERVGDLFDYVDTHKPSITHHAAWILNDGTLDLALYIDHIATDSYLVGAALYRDGAFNADTEVSCYYASADRIDLDAAVDIAFCETLNRAFRDDYAYCVQAIILSLPHERLSLLEGHMARLEPGVADLVRLQRTCLSAKASAERDAPGLAL